MLNEVRARHLKELVVERITPGRTVGAIIGFEIARREDTIEGLKAHATREREEIKFLESLDAKELHKEAGEKMDG